ncbi:VirB3 family type IV secretion system protein [Neisseria wadsworthii]|uniref:VirB3 family type IV secretion system protein n=1 Tax=Neisseria wadsworthii TaxID=607711 RepID=UPI000D324C96|nr:VirB3 family type IV secretion system protein [Neisseria wadsworthii]
MTENIDTEQPTFNGMARQAMVIGVPLPALAASGFVGMMATMISLPILEGSALFFLLLPIPFILFFRTICANDDQAIRMYVYELKWFLRKKNSKLFGGTNTLLSTKFGRDLSDYQRFFEQGSAKTACSIRFSTQDLPTRHQ